MMNPPLIILFSCAAAFSISCGDKQNSGSEPNPVKLDEPDGAALDAARKASINGIDEGKKGSALLRKKAAELIPPQ